ncbi:Concanavalin A-like lectin/glucanase subgroup [Penicillium canariense]|uniref:Concanavalin A-like lectin/glucanase subgroup n=1 Tax=Penicillium canariense TaxID=189055 RepID=A0A9W9HL24_9EURO|nr:Concanavalin A-like lectin/glucanase subgroup [Penicillium canariense]KAJ5150334.1 Concanavalin A-like lectin/glucanase subgroup [Penicillium canariense]
MRSQADPKPCPNGHAQTPRFKECRAAPPASTHLTSLSWMLRRNAIPSLPYFTMALDGQHPIIPGFAPDPSICLIGDTFFLVNSSFHLFPGLPIYTSSDLVSWTHIGNAMNRRSQLSLSRATTWITPWDDGTSLVATGGLYAPTIRHHKGITYIICTNVVHESNTPGDEHSEQFILHTTDIHSGLWSDPIIFPFPGIDPSLLFDDEKTYVQVCKTGPQFQIFNFEVDIATGKMLTEPALIWNGWARSYTEGPHVYRKDGWYYLLCAEGGTFRHHMLSIARSRSIWGPFESYSKNPLYSADGTDHYVQHTGHGDFFQDQHGQWWVVMLGVRMAAGRSIMGRETFLAAVNWPDDEWPCIDVVPHRDRPDTTPWTTGRGSSPVAAWVYLRDPILENYHLQGHRITIRASPEGLHQADQAVSFAGQRQRRLVGTAGVTLCNPVPGHAILSQAGLTLYKDEHRSLTIAYDFPAKQVIFGGLNRSKSYRVKHTHAVKLEGSIQFQIRYTERSLGFFFLHDSAGPWQCMQLVDTAVMTDFDFTGPVIGMFAVGDGVEVQFTDFKIDDDTHSDCESEPKSPSESSGQLS